MIAAEITSLSLSAVGLAFAAGLLSFSSPCVLPLLPVYLSFISGVGVEELGREHRRLLWTSLLFVAGFTAVFVLMGAGAGGVGRCHPPSHESWGRARSSLQRSRGWLSSGLPEPALKVWPCAAGAGRVPRGAALAVAGRRASLRGSARSSRWPHEPERRLGLSCFAGVLAGLAAFRARALAFDRMRRPLGWVKRIPGAIQASAGACWRCRHPHDARRAAAAARAGYRRFQLGL